MNRVRSSLVGRKRAAPAPAKNSPVRAFRISHCSGAVSLRLVHQDVVDAAVQLVQHPGRVGPPGQELAGLQDQVGEVQGAARLLGPVVGAHIGGRQDQGMHRVLRDAGGAEAFAGGLQPVLFAQQRHAQAFAPVERLGGLHPFDRRARAVLREQGAEGFGQGRRCRPRTSAWPRSWRRWPCRPSRLRPPRATAGRRGRPWPRPPPPPPSPVLRSRSGARRRTAGFPPHRSI